MVGHTSNLNTGLTSLKRVAEHFTVSLYEVRKWKLKGCPELGQSPYDPAVIAEWLSKDETKRNSDTDDLEREKLELEIEKLEKEGRTFMRDPAFWLALSALGVAISPEVREWLKSQDSNSEKECFLEKEPHLNYRRVKTLIKYNNVELVDTFLITPLPGSGQFQAISLQTDRVGFGETHGDAYMTLMLKVVSSMEDDRLLGPLSDHPVFKPDFIMKCLRVSTEEHELWNTELRKRLKRGSVDPVSGDKQ